MNDWLGLTLTRKVKDGDKTKTIKTTDKWAINYAAKKFGVEPEDIELERDETIIKVRVIPETEVEFISFEQFTYDVYGFPDEDDPYYETYKQFGYSTWLIKAYPEEWGIGEYDRLLFDLRCDYHWYRLEEFLGEDIGDDVGNTLNDFLAGHHIIVQLPGLLQQIPLNFPTFSCGILIWEEERETFCLFLDDKGDMYPILAKNENIEVTDEVFDGFE